MKLGCTPCSKVGTLGVETKMGMKLSKEWADNEITQWFPTFFLSRRILEKNENYLAHLEYFEYKVCFLHITTKN